MADATTSDDQELEAGDFSSWMDEVLGAINGEHGSDVPCDGCTACCTASQFIHIGPDEVDTLSCIPAELLFPAPRLPRGHVVLGYDERGHCPMLVDNRCSIYEHRPRTCRTYDCRIFPATGLALDEVDKALINQRARRWRFSHPSDADQVRHEAVKSAATFLRQHPDVVPDGARSGGATQLAVLAIQVHDVFLGSSSDTEQARVVEPDPGAMRVELTRRLRDRGAT